MAEPEWEYGFYDSHPAANWRDEPQPQENPTIWWYVFGFLTHKTAESAEHTGSKSCWGYPIIVRRRVGSSEWEHNPKPAGSGSDS